MALVIAAGETTEQDSAHHVEFGSNFSCGDELEIFQYYCSLEHAQEPAISVTFSNVVKILFAVSARNLSPWSPGYGIR